MKTRVFISRILAAFLALCMAVGMLPDAGVMQAEATSPAPASDTALSMQVQQLKTDIAGLATPEPNNVLVQPPKLATGADNTSADNLLKNLSGDFYIVNASPVDGKTYVVDYTAPTVSKSDPETWGRIGATEVKVVKNLNNEAALLGADPACAISISRFTDFTSTTEKQFQGFAGSSTQYISQHEPHII